MDGKQPNTFIKQSDVLYQDNHIIVVNKPPELATMGAAPGKPSLHRHVSQYLKHHFQKPGNVYLGVVSRLDAMTGGVIVFAKTSKAAKRLTAAFSSSEVEKHYLAIVSGTLLPDRNQLVDYVKKDDIRKRMVVCNKADPQGKRAELNYRVLGMVENQTLVQVQPITGRKHQIRVQFAQRQHPILGDQKYGSRKRFAMGIALLAQSISLLHPVRKTRMTFAIEIPKYWKIHRFGVNSTDLISPPDGNRLS